jgi:hypothetical protein
MNRIKIVFNKRLFVAIFLGAFVLALLPTGGANASTLPQSCGRWSIVASPSKDTQDILYGITAISPSDVWAVGRYVDTQNEALIEHWNGKQWSIVKSPDLKPADSYLLAIAAVSSADVWAVGSSSSSILIEHWNGANWSVLPSPGVGALYGVAPISSTDIWAAGASARRTIVAHWNGKRWSEVPNPNPGKFGNGFSAITAISSTDVWAVGSEYTTKFGFQSLIEHWNGKQWGVVKSPSPTQYPYELRAVSAVSANDIWATGDYTVSPGDVMLTLTEHWNGTMWNIVPSPSPTGDDGLFGVSALSASDVWAVGDSTSGGHNLVVQWNGTDWNVVTSPHPHGTVSSFLAVSADSAADVWAAGFDINNRNFTYQTLIEHYCSSGND